MDFKAEQWDGVTRAQFIKAVLAEGVPIGPYIPFGLHKYDWVDFICNLDAYKKMYGEKRLKEYKEMTKNLPICDRVADRMLLIQGSPVLTADQSAMDDIINAFNKVWDNRDKVKTIKV